MLVLVLAFGLVFGIARLLSTGGSGDPDVDASTVGGSPTATTTTTASPSASATESVREPRKKKDKGKKPLPEPDGPCDDADVVVTPRVKKAHVGDPVKVILELSTEESKACLWEVSPDSVFVTISQDATTLWSSQECPSVIPTEDVVPRREKADKVSLTWNGKESDETCSSATDWVVMGTYLVTAVARGATEPQDALFVLGGPTRETVTPTPTPTPREKSEESEPEESEDAEESDSERGKKDKKRDESRDGQAGEEDQGGR